MQGAKTEQPAETTSLVDDPRASSRASSRAWHERLTASFKRLTEDPQLLASIERRGF